MIFLNDVNRTSSNLRDISRKDDLKFYLQNHIKNKKNTYNGSSKYVLHYTSESALIGIMKSKKWYCNTPENMNDGVELQWYKNLGRPTIYFASFLYNNKETIGLWSMYSQPWSKGIAIRIPIEMIKRWVESDFLIYEADKTSKQVKKVITNANCSYCSVAYTDFEVAEKQDVLSIRCDSKTSSLPREEVLDPSMFGYIKDSAWEYENEFRIRVDTEHRYDAVLIDIPEDVINSFEIITGPRFEGNLLADIRKEVDIGFSDRRIIPSYYTGRLRWVYCDSCKEKE